MLCWWRTAAFLHSHAACTFTAFWVRKKKSLHSLLRSPQSFSSSWIHHRDFFQTEFLPCDCSYRAAAGEKKSWTYQQESCPSSEPDKINSTGVLKGNKAYTVTGGSHSTIISLMSVPSLFRMCAVIRDLTSLSNNLFLLCE